MTDPKQALLTNRIIWAAMAMGMVAFAGVMIALARSQEDVVAPVGEADPMLFYIACAMVVTAIPMGLFVRGQVFKRGWVGDVVTPQAYTAGNIIAWACCEAPAFFALITIFIDGRVVPNILPAAAAIVMHLLLWPNGRAMFPPNLSQVEANHPAVTERK
jgi:hypothetical protein